MPGYRIEDKFRQAESGLGGGYLRVSAEHRVDMFVGVEDKRRALLLICDQEPPEGPALDVITAHRRKREDGRWAFVVCLEQRELGELFAYLIENLVLATKHETDGHRAAVRLIERLRWWQRMLSRRRPGVLEDSELRGLIGELLFLRDHAIPKLGTSAAVGGWVGPLDAPRDFRFHDCDVEVKAIGRDVHTVRISSAEQLASGGVPISLAVFVLESAAQGGLGAFSAQEIVNSIRTLCEPEVETVTALLQRLSAAGYIDVPEYEKIFFVAKPPTFYSCTQEFPVLIPATLPEGIIQCTYQIDLASISNFETADWR